MTAYRMTRPRPQRSIRRGMSNPATTFAAAKTMAWSDAMVREVPCSSRSRA